MTGKGLMESRKVVEALVNEEEKRGECLVIRAWNFAVVLGREG